MISEWGGGAARLAHVSLDLRGWQRRLDRLLDPAIAVAVLALSLLPLLDARACDCHIGTWAWLLVVGQAVPLVFRRRWPFTTSLLAGLLTLTYGLTTLPDPPVPYAGLVALYTAAAHATRRLAYAAGAVAAVGIAVSIVVDWPASDLQDVVVNYLLFATAWLLGDSARNRRERAAELERRAEQAERTRAAEAERAVAAERNRIARELHDIVAHHVSMMVVQAEAGPVLAGRDPRRAAEVFDSISATGKQALAEMRRLLGVLRHGDERQLAPQPTLAELDQLVSSVRAAGTDVTVEVTGEAPALPAAVELSAYRLVQEALTNAVRHAAPARVVVRIGYTEHELGVEVADDGAGAGAPPSPAGGGHGLLAMRERVALVGGTLEAGPGDGRGWRVRARLPLHPVATP